MCFLLSICVSYQASTYTFGLCMQPILFQSYKCSTIIIYDAKAVMKSNKSANNLVNVQQQYITTLESCLTRN